MFLVKVLSCLLLVSLALAGTDEREQAYKDCMKEYKLTAGDLGKIVQEPATVDKCFFQCVGDKLKYMDGNKILMDKAEQLLAGSDESGELKKQLGPIMKKCGEEVSAKAEGKEKCWAAAEWNICIQKAMEKQ